MDSITAMYKSAMYSKWKENEQVGKFSKYEHILHRMSLSVFHLNIHMELIAIKSPKIFTLYNSLLVEFFFKSNSLQCPSILLYRHCMYLNGMCFINKNSISTKKKSNKPFWFGDGKIVLFQESDFLCKNRKY